MGGGAGEGGESAWMGSAEENPLKLIRGDWLEWAMRRPIPPGTGGAGMRGEVDRARWVEERVMEGNPLGWVRLRKIHSS